MTDEGVFQTKTFAVLCSVDNKYRKKIGQSRVYKRACVKMNGWETVIVYRHGVPIAVCSNILVAVYPQIRKAEQTYVDAGAQLLACPEYFMDVPSLVYPA